MVGQPIQNIGKIYTDNGLKDGVKAAFLKNSKKYLEAVQKNLEGIGHETTPRQERQAAKS